MRTRRFTFAFLLIVVFLSLLSIQTFAQDDFATIAPEDATVAPVDDVAVVDIEETVPVEPVPVEDESPDSTVLVTVIGILMIGLGITVLALLAVLIVVLMYVSRSLTPTLLKALPPEWAPFIIGGASSVDKLALSLAERLRAKAAETDTPIDDKFLERIFGAMNDLPPLPTQSQTARLKLIVI